MKKRTPMGIALEATHAHQKEHHKIASGILRRFARESQVPYPLVLNLFLEGNHDITIIFWDRLNGLHPGRFSGVSWCQTCRKFNLEERTH